MAGPALLLGGGHNVDITQVRDGVREDLDSRGMNPVVIADEDSHSICMLNGRSRRGKAEVSTRACVPKAGLVSFEGRARRGISGALTLCLSQGTCNPL